MSAQPVRREESLGTQSFDTQVLDVPAELDRQLATLVDLGYPEAAGLSVSTLVLAVESLREPLVARQATMRAPAAASAPFVVVVSRRLVPAEQSMPLLRRAGKPGFVTADLADIGRFEPIAGLDVPGTDVYALLDVERGDEYLNQSPDEALPTISARERGVLTYDEGIAMVTHFPHLLEPNRCFMLVGSRCGDRRVPALWISGGTGKDGRGRRGAPKLGWCWAGNRHTWLGHSSCGARLAP